MGPRVAFDLFGLPVYWYGIILTSGMLAATWVAAHEMKRKGHDPEIAWNGMITVLALGIIGARLYHVFSTPGDGTNSGWAFYSQNPLQILNLRNGGLGIFGGLIGGTLGVVIMAVRAKFPFWRLADCIVPGVALGQAIGRWGNFANQELYGGPTGSSWWGITIDAGSRIRTRQIDFTDLEKFPIDTRFHPTFFYESMWNLAGFLLLMWLARRFQNRLPDGVIAGLYFIWYGIGRAWTELLFRPDAWVVGASGLPTAVLISGLSVLFGAGTILWARRQAPPQTPQQAISN
jgi:phosphatidylglycerol:prolipoprotein diacylglycerol transferase